MPAGDSQPGVTALLLAWRAGSQDALEQLTPLIYQELRRLAHRYMRREPPGHLLQTTALIHEAYLRLVDLDVDWQGRSHFLAISAGLMRRILVDFARHEKAAKRGGGAIPLGLDEVQPAAPPATELLEVDRALERLAAFDPRKGRVIELRFFGGLTIAEMATVLEVSHATVERDLKLAKAWLAEALGPPPARRAPRHGC